MPTQIFHSHIPVPTRGLQALCLQGLGLTLSLALPLSAQQVSPADRAAYEGSSSTSYPLGRANGRFQQLHADIPAGTQIQGHAYRRDAISLRGQVPAFRSEMSVELSISPRMAHAPSKIFADNQGLQQTAVLPKTWISFPSTDRPLQDPADKFVLKIPYATPFRLPASGGVICLDTRVYGNQIPSGANKNFSAYLDAHAASAIKNEQPGFRFGAGCPAPGRRTAHYAAFGLTARGAGHDLKIASRYGIPSTASTSVIDVMILGLAINVTPWPNTTCTVYPRFDVRVPLPGSSDASGHHNVNLNGLPNLPIGQRLFTQIASGDVGSGSLSFSDGSILTIPPAAPAAVPASRIANGGDRTGLTGATSFIVPVTEFY